MRTTTRRALLLSAFVVPTSLAAETAPPAQTAADDAVEEIVVTAQKREQSLQDVPISISVLTAQDLAENRIERFADYAVRVPNVAFSNRGTRAETRIAIRGVGPISTGGTANLVGIFVDEFNIAPNISTKTADPSLFDAEQIEVLKGPQGTFFGRNVVAGAISIRSVKPDPEAFGGEATLGYSSFDTWEGRAALNVPVSEAAAVRAVGYYDRSDGWLTNRGPYGKADETENYGARLAFRYEPTDAMTLDLSGSYSKNFQALPTFVPTGFASSSLDLLNGFRQAVPGTPTFPITPDGRFPANTDTMRTDMGLPSRNRTFILAGRLEYELSDAVTLTNVTGYIDNRFRSEGEGDFTVNPSFTIRRDEDVSALSTELRLSGGGDRFSWLVGALYSRDEFRSYDNSVHLASDPFRTLYDVAFSVLGGTVCPRAVTGLPVNIPGPCPGFRSFTLGQSTSVGFFENVTTDLETDSYAVFGNLSFELIPDRLTVDLGGRYSHDSITGSRTEGPLISALAVRTSRPESDIDFSDFSPRAAVTFEVSRAVTLYALASRGYRTGGFNSIPNDPPFEKETLWNYEGGVKLLALDNRARINLAAFHMDWKNTQVRAQDPLTQRQFILNAEGSKHRGFEAEVALIPHDRVQVDFAAGYVKATFRDFRNARDLDGRSLDATGRPVPLSPRWSLAAGVQWTPRVSETIDGLLRAEYQFKDESREDVSLNNRRLNPEYELVNLRFGFSHDRYSLTAYVENLFDEEYRYGTSNLETFLSGAQASIGERRRYGVTGTVRF